MIERKNPGSGLKASEVNELADAAHRVSNMSGGGGVKVSSSSAGLALRMATPGRGLTEPAMQARAVNVSSGDFKAFQPVTLAGHFFSGADAQAKRVFNIDAPISGDEGWFAICAEPIAKGAVGRVYISGCCLARLSNPDQSWFAEISEGKDCLIGKNGGAAQIIWEDAFTGPDDTVHLALVRFPCVGGDGITQMKVVSISDDYLVCNSWDGTTQGTDAVKVAKPWQLRRTPFDGKTYNGITYTYSTAVTRSATDGTNTETQVIVPAYVVGDVIYTAGVAGLLADETVKALDVNVDGRAWAKQ